MFKGKKREISDPSHSGSKEDKGLLTGVPQRGQVRYESLQSHPSGDAKTGHRSLMHAQEIFADIWITENIGGAPGMDYFSFGKYVAAV